MSTQCPTIKVYPRTKASLDVMKVNGDTYDHVIKRLIKFWEDHHQAEAAR